MFKYIFSVLVVFFTQSAHAYECNEEIDNLALQNNVRIICKLSSINEDQGSIKLVQAEQNMIDNSTEAIKAFFKSYNRDFIKDKINNIYIFKKINYLDSKVDGLSDGENIWLNLADFSETKAFSVYLETLHHEFSSNVYKKASLVKRFVWKKISSSYYYTVSFLKKCLNDYQYCQSTSKQMFEDGFLKMYSMTNDENDFNVYAQTLFTDPQKLKDLDEKYPLIHKKLEKLKEFYRDLGFKGKFPDET